MKRITPILVLIALFALGVISIANAGEKQSQNAPTIQEPVNPNATVIGGAGELQSLRVSEADQEAAVKYWTRELMLEAEALPMPEYKSDEQKEALTIPLEAEKLLIPDAPSKDYLAAAKAENPEEWAFGEDDLQKEMTNSSASFSRWTIWNNRSYPYSAMGKLFFRVPGQGNSSCSASVVPSGNGRGSVLTASHCLYTPGRGWHTNVVFVPSFNNGSRPYGSFALPTLWAYTNWTSSRYYDVAMACPSVDLDNRVGSLGLRWNSGYVKSNMRSFGYPGNIGGGNRLITCLDTTWRQSNGIIAMGCDMTYGSSGGPWVDQFYAGYSSSRNYANSVVSGPSTSVPFGQGIAGPYFNSGNVGQLYNLACR